MCRRFGAVEVLHGSISIGDLNAFMLYAVFVGGSAGGLAGTTAQVIAAVSFSFGLLGYALPTQVNISQLAPLTGHDVDDF